MVLDRRCGRRGDRQAGLMFSLIRLPYKIAFVAIFLAVYGAVCWFKGNEHGTQKLTEYIGEQAKEAVRIVTKQGEVTTQVVTEYVKVKGATQVVTQTVEKEVVKYADSNPGSCLDPAWRRLHDDAAANKVAGRTTTGLLLRASPALAGWRGSPESGRGDQDGDGELRPRASDG